MSYSKFQNKIVENKFKRNDILFIPHLYDIRWARTISEFMKNYFYCPIQNLQFYPYMECRSKTLEMIGSVLPNIRNNEEIQKVFYFNLGDDFNIELVRAGGIKKVFGILHSSSFMEYEFRNDNKEQLHEKSVIQSSEKVFVPSETIITDEIYSENKFEVIGLPIIQDKCPLSVITNKNDFILFNHRLNVNKNPEFLFSFSKKMKDRTIISIPSGHTTYIGMAKKEFKNFYLNPPEHLYLELLKTSRYGFVVSHKESFSVSFIDAIMSGVLYFCLNNDKIGIKKYIPSECIINDLAEFEEKIQYYDEHPKKRIELIIEIQNSLLQKFEKEKWIENLLKKI